MSRFEHIIVEVAAALEQEPSVNIHRFPVQIKFSDGVLTLEGEMEQIAAKKKALDLAAAVKGVTGIVDRLRLVPAAPMEDGEIRDHVCNALLAENLLASCAIWAIVKKKPEVVREADQGMDGSIDIEVDDGVVILNGAVTSLSEKRLAGVLAWWVPGSRDVVNGIEVVPPEEDTDDEIVDAVRLVLEKDPFVNAGQVKVTCRNFAVTIEGLVKNETQRKMVETDCWFVFRVNRVNNLLQVEE
ncbi:MAG: BON domain-containing protein [Proteobacteria bacterium]|nr:BON domain-containing protein [Pseudomonadota bacterium]